MPNGAKIIQSQSKALGEEKCSDQARLKGFQFDAAMLLF